MTLPGKKQEESLKQAEYPLLRAEVEAVARSRGAMRARAALARAARVAVVTKFRFMGDTVVATPFLRQLRSHLPNAEITLITAPSVVTALQNCPHVDRMAALEMRDVGRWQHGRQLLHVLQSGRFDAVFALNRSLFCAILCAVARIPVRIGYVNESRGPFLTVPIPYRFDRNEVDCHLDMLRALGLPAQDALPELWFTPEERAQARTLLCSRGWSGTGFLLGIQPGANDPWIREWGAEKYARVADTLLDQHGGTTLVMGGAAERATAERMAAAMRYPPICLVGALDLRAALTVIGLCDLWLGNDTGLLHAAVAQNTPSVGLFGPNKVVRWGYDAPLHRSLVSFPAELARDDAAVRRCLDAIPEQQVLSTANAVLRAAAEEASDRASGRLRAAPAASAPYFAASLDPGLRIPVRRR